MEYSCIFVNMLQTYSFRNVYRVSESVIVISKLNGKKRFRKIVDRPFAEGRTRFTESHVEKIFVFLSRLKFLTWTLTWICSWGI
jgi:hypothetical protein